MKTLARIDCAQSGAGVYSPSASVYDHGDSGLATLAINLHGGSAQIGLTPKTARELAEALTEWADRTEGEA